MTRLRDERLKQDLTVEWIAVKVGVAQPSISQYESGKKKPGLEKLRKWLRALKMPEEWADAWADHQVVERVDKALPPDLEPEERRFVKRAVASVLTEHRRGETE